MDTIRIQPILAQDIVQIEPVDATQAEELIYTWNRFFILDLSESGGRDIKLIVGFLRSNERTYVLHLTEAKLQAFAHSLEIFSWRRFYRQADFEVHSYRISLLCEPWIK